MTTITPSQTYSLPDGSYVEVDRYRSANGEVRIHGYLTQAPASPGADGLVERDAFEEWACNDHRDLTPLEFEEREPDNNHYYETDSVNEVYIGWCARASLASEAHPTPAPTDAGALTYGQTLIAEAIEAHFGEREFNDDPDDDGDTTKRDVWDAFEALSAAPLPVPAAQTVAVEEMRQTACELRADSNGDCNTAQQAIYWDKKADALAAQEAPGVVEATSIDALLNHAASKIACDEWFRRENGDRSASEVEQFTRRVRSVLLDAACEMAKPYRDRAETAEAALAAPSAPVVTALDWHAAENFQTADTIIGRYKIAASMMNPGKFHVGYAGGPVCDLVDGADAAKAAAQADYSRRILSALQAAPVQQETWRPTHRHVKRGSEYQVIGVAEGQISKPHIEHLAASFVREGDKLTIYQAKDGRLWWRFPSEFNDGRFEPIPAAPAREKAVESTSTARSETQPNRNEGMSQWRS